MLGPMIISVCSLRRLLPLLVTGLACHGSANAAAADAEETELQARRAEVRKSVSAELTPFLKAVQTVAPNAIGAPLIIYESGRIVTGAFRTAALLALAEVTRATGRELLDALVLGVDVEDLVLSIDNMLMGRRLARVDFEQISKRIRRTKRVLVVDDDSAVRDITTTRQAHAPGLRADLNLIDYENLSFEMPYMAYDLPANGRRLVQKAKGYAATFCNGVQTVDDDAFTGELPGVLFS